MREGPFTTADVLAEMPSPEPHHVRRARMAAQAAADRQAALPPFVRGIMNYPQVIASGIINAIPQGWQAGVDMVTGKHGLVTDPAFDTRKAAEETLNFAGGAGLAAAPFMRATSPALGARTEPGALTSIAKGAKGAGDDIFDPNTWTTPEPAPMPAPNINRGTELMDHSPHIPIQPVGAPPAPYYKPARGSTERMTDAAGQPAVQRAVNKAVGKGLDDVPGVALDFYNTGGLREQFHNLYRGADSPDVAYRQFIDMVGATSPQSPTPQNVASASDLYGRLQRGEPIPDASTSWPDYAVGPAAGTQLTVAQKMAGQHAKSFDPTGSPKVDNFRGNLAGHQDQATIDSHAARLIGMSHFRKTGDPAFLSSDPIRRPNGRGGYEQGPSPQDMFNTGQLSSAEALDTPALFNSRPRKNEYGDYAAFLHKAAKKFGINPAQAQAAAWFGGGDMTGLKSPPLTFQQVLERRVFENAERRGVSPQQVFNEMINGKVPLLEGSSGVAPFVAIGGDDELP